MRRYLPKCTGDNFFDLRRAELQKAAYEVVHAVGFNAATVEDVARHVGMSKGIVHHYFDSKHQLLEFATRYAQGILGQAARQRLRRVKSPSERLWAIIEANFAPELEKLTGKTVEVVM